MGIDIGSEELFSIEQLVEKLGVSRRTLEMKRKEGKFPEPTTYVFDSPRWSSGCINGWLERQKEEASRNKFLKRLGTPFHPVKGPVKPVGGMQD